MITLTIRHSPMRTTLTLPMPDQKLQQELINAFGDAPQRATVADISPQALAMLDGKEVDLDELNFLAKSIERFTQDEMSQFMAAVQVEQPTDLKALINLSFNLERYTLVQNTADLAAIGKRHLLNKQGGLSTSEVESIDFEQIGRYLLSSGQGVPSAHGLVFKNSEVPYHEAYNGTTFPCYDYRGDAIAMAQLEYSGKTEYLYLPEDGLAIIKAARRLDAPSSDMCKATLTDFTIDNPWWMKHFETVLREDGIWAANEMAVLFPKSDEDMEKLSAVMEYADVSSIEDITQLTKHLDDFVFAKGATSDEDVGRHFVDFDSEYSASPEVMNYIDFDALGSQIIEDYCGEFVEGGFVCMDHGCSLEQILEQDESMTMGGI